MTYTVSYTRTAAKELATITRGDRKLGKQLADAADALADDPRPDGCKKLSNGDYRIRVREYRVLYTVSDHTVTVVVYRFAPRGSAYN